jgi:hypothetical protein
MPPSPYKISSKSTNLFKPCAHLRSLNVRHFGTVEATRLSRMESYVIFNVITSIQNHPNLPISSKVAPPQKFKRSPFWNG